MVPRTTATGYPNAAMITSSPAAPKPARPGLLRVNMRITDAATSEYLWAGRHEFKPEDLAPIQTRITRRISRELHVLLLQAASRRALADFGHGFRGYGCLSEASSALKGKVTPELTAKAQTWYLAALAHDPRNVEALTGLALTCQHLVSNPWWGDPRAAAAASDLGREAVAIALDLAPGHAVAKCIQGMLYSAAGQLELAARAFRAGPRNGSGAGSCAWVCGIQCGPSWSRRRDVAGD